MDEKRLVIAAVSVVLAVSTVTLLAVTMSAKHGGENTEPRRNKTTPLLLISLDGYRSDYFFRYQPTLKSMAENGVKAHFMMPSYPTVTFPNHYTIVTGLYPESHGIVANNFYDPDFNESFAINMKVKDGKWWGGEPIWHTLTRQNKTSATFFWPGSDFNITGHYPTYYRPFDKAVPFEERIDQVVEWLSLPDETRPDWVCVYLDEPDSTGHAFGPNTAQVDDILIRVDGMMNRLLSGLRRNDMEDKVNIIVLADHGMAHAGKEKYINLTDYDANIESSTTQITYGAFTMMNLKENVAIEDMLNKLSCPPGAPSIRAFPPEDLPTRFHYSYNSRIGDIVLDFDSGYYTTYNYTLDGEHGYDNHDSFMEALFIATGPDFKKGVLLEPFQNIEIYNLMCYLTEVEPAPNNGTEGALYAALLDPPELPEVPVEDLLVPEYPTILTEELLTMAQCRDNNLTEEEQQQLQEININQNEQLDLTLLHLPWGIPSSGNQSADVILLYHKDHVTGYSEKLKMPVWTSFTVNNPPQGTPRNESLWLSDVRLNISNTPTCESYLQEDLSMFPLFPPELSTNGSLDLIPYLVSNSVPLETTTRIMDYLADFLQQIQMKQKTSINVKLGPVFDNNADSLPDDFLNSTNLQVPSDLFMVITHCREVGVSIHNCGNDSLDAVSFIIPEKQTVDNNCKMDPDYTITMFLSTVHDVELATGLTFYPELEPSTRLQLALRIHRNVKETLMQKL
ncbi:venom phosphodiesterase-like isoform X2 [Scylla paramamosain]|uniref:venom phosphodiesterase-like isoform X2 n=1 Tax=Scylla paramamosain TaxID=85552 RepID=UPI0030835C99